METSTPLIPPTPGARSFEAIAQLIERARRTTGKLDELCVEGGAAIDASWLEALASWEGARSLRTLRLRRAPLDAQGCRVIARGFPSLRALEIAGAGLDDEAVVALWEAHTFEEIEEIRLPDNALGDGAARAIAYASRVRALRALDLRGNEGITDAGARALDRRLDVGLRALGALDLRGCSVSAPWRIRLRERVAEREAVGGACEVARAAAL